MELEKPAFWNSECKWHPKLSYVHACLQKIINNSKCFRNHVYKSWKIESLFVLKANISRPNLLQRKIGVGACHLIFVLLC